MGLILTRKQNWEDALVNHILRDDFPKYSLKNFNCVHWSALAIEAMTGINPLDRYKWNPKDDLKERCSEIFGEPQLVANSRRGDLVLLYIPSLENYSAGIVIGRNAVYFELEGMTQVKVKHASYSWRI